MGKSIQVQDIPRVNQIAGVLAKNGFGHVFNVIGLSMNLPPADPDVPTRPWARRVRQALTDLGPAFVKLGQVLSVRPDILPADLLVEFESLQDRVTPMSFDDVRYVVEGELDEPLEEVFAEFDEEPLGSASIAQVHRARLKSGQEVAVKLQRRGIEKKIRSDLAILYTLAQMFEGNMTIPGLYTPTAIVREFDVAITQELDFLQELKAAERLRRHFEDDEDVLIPEVLPRLSTRRMMVMELVKGRPLKEVIPSLEGEDRKKIAHLIMEATYRQVYDFGFFHGDPHPGNLFVTPDHKLVYLDFGVVGTLTGAMQDTIIGSFTSMVFRDAETLAMTVYRAGATQGRVDLRTFIDEIEKMMLKYYGASLDDIANTATFVEIVQMCSRFHISLPPEFAVLSRAIGLVEGEVRALLPGVDIVEEVKPYAQRLMARRFAPERVAHDMAKGMVMLQGHFKELPTQFNQMLMDLERGNITIVTQDPDAMALREEIRAAVLRLSLAFLASTVSIGSLLFLAAWSPAPFGIPLFGLFGMLMVFAGMGLFGMLGVHVLFEGLFDWRVWRRRVLGVLRFFSWRRDS